MHDVVIAASNYLKYEGINISPLTFMKAIDVYMRITLTLCNGECDNTKAAYTIFDGSQHIDFSSMSDEGIESIKNYVASVAKIAEAPFDYAELGAILTDKNIVTVFKTIHLFLDIIIGFADRYLSGLKFSITSPFEFRSYDEDDDSGIKIIGYYDDNHEKRHLFVSDCLLREIPEQPVMMV